MASKLSNIFKIKYPIIQGGMIWCSGWRLASAVSNSGGLGLIGAGSMNPELLKEHITKAKLATKNTFGVNLPLIYPYAEDMIKIIIDEKVKVVFTSAGNPATWTQELKKHGIKVAHVVANSKFAIKAQDADVDAIVVEGFEAGGHNGREESTTFTLIPTVRQHIVKPIIAAGGIATGKAMLAAMILGADGVQIGSRFVASQESSAHVNFKTEIVKAIEGSTHLAFKNLIPVRLIKNEFCIKVIEAENKGASREDLSNLLSHGRAKLGMFNGDINNGELEIGQISSLIKEIKPVKNIIDDIILEYKVARQQITHPKYDV